MGTAVIVNTVADIVLGEIQHEHMELGQLQLWVEEEQSCPHKNKTSPVTGSWQESCCVSGSSETVRVKVFVLAQLSHCC